MKTFPDSPISGAPKTWAISLTIGAVKRIRDLLKVDLLNLDQGDPPLIGRMAADAVLVVDVLYVLCKAEADACQISDEQFAERLGGNSFRLAWEALQAELTDFFLGLGRPEVAKVIAANAKVVLTQIRAMEEKFGQLEAAVVRKIRAKADALDVEKLIEQTTPGRSSTDSPDSSA